MQRLDALILAAGLGTRMRSDLIKILHEAAGKAIIEYVVETARSLTDTPPLVVVGHQQDRVRARCGDAVEYCVQEQQLGTGHAVMRAEAALRARGIEGSRLLLLSGDVPLITRHTLARLIEEHDRQSNLVTVLTMKPGDPAEYGRIVRDHEERIVGIVEARDATSEQKAIREVNSGTYVFDTRFVLEALHRTSTDNAQGEYYLTDVVAAAASAGFRAGAVAVDDPIEVLGINSRSELAMIEQELNRRTVERLMHDGVTFRNPNSVLIDDGVEIGRDSIVYPFVCIEGATRIGAGCVIGPSSQLRDCQVGDRVNIRAGTVAEGATIGDDCSVGPHAHLRPGTVLGRSVRIGNYVETKKAVFGDGSKASHLSYIGDAEVGRDVNIGAGTITCNYDGVNKHKTTIEDGAFIGSDSQLVAPVTIGKGAYVGAGSTITRDVPPDALALTRSPQKVHEGWAARRRKP